MENRTSFGLDAGAYRAHRPTYPESLFAWLAGLCKRRHCALDCATGNGQAALSLTEWFDEVVATDTDAAQIASAQVHPQVRYMVVAAEELPPETGTFDLVTIAQGAHWFDLDVFYERLRPLLAPGAVVAIWGYSHCRVNPAIDALLDEYLVGPVDPYWAQGNRIIMDHYRTIPFPWDEIQAPQFAIHERWNRDAFFSFVRTWSSYKKLLAAGAPDPLTDVAAQLDAGSLWPDGQVADVYFDLHLRVGRVAS